MVKMQQVAACLLVCLCAIPLQMVARPDPLSTAAPFTLVLPDGRELEDDELLGVEGELFFLFTILIYTAAFAAAGAAGATVHENWFDEDYGIDSDDLRNIGSGAATGAICGATGGILHCVPI